MLNDQPARTAQAARALTPDRVSDIPALRRRAAPGTRGLELLALAFGLPQPPTGLGAAAAEVMADLIRELDLPPGSRAWHDALQGLLRPVMDAAVAARREAEDEFRQATLALENLRDAREAREDRRLLALLERGAERLVARAAELLIVAHMRSEEAEGAARAVRLARRGGLSALLVPRSCTDLPPSGAGSAR